MNCLGRCELYLHSIVLLKDREQLLGHAKEMWMKAGKGWVPSQREDNHEYRVVAATKRKC